MINFLMKTFMVLLLLVPLFVASYACFTGSFSYLNKPIKVILFFLGLILFTQSSIEVEKILELHWFLDSVLYILTLSLLIIISMKRSLKMNKQKSFKRMNPKSLSRVSGIKR